MNTPPGCVYCGKEVCHCAAADERQAVIEAALAWRVDREALFDVFDAEDLALIAAVDAYLAGVESRCAARGVPLASGAQENQP